MRKIPIVSPLTVGMGSIGDIFPRPRTTKRSWWKLDKLPGGLVGFAVHHTIFSSDVALIARCCVYAFPLDKPEQGISIEREEMTR